MSSFGRLRIGVIAIRKSVQREEKIKLTNLLSSTVLCQYSQPLDRVYAVLGLASPEAQGAMTIDYTKDLSQLFSEATKVCVETEGSLNVLSFVQHFTCLPQPCFPRADRQIANDLQLLIQQPLMEHEQGELGNSKWKVKDLENIQEDLLDRDRGVWQTKRKFQESKLSLPSWVPDWEAFQYQHILPLYREDSFHASKGITPDVSFSSGLGTITVTGLKLDSIEILYPRDCHPFQVIHEMGLLKRAFLLVRSRYDRPAESHETLLENILRTLVANRSLLGEVPAPDDFLNQLRVTCGIGKIPTSFAPEISHRVDRFMNYVYPAQRRLCHTMDHRRFFVTTQGHYGIGPRHIVEGDEVCILYGADMPFIMRHCNDYWKLLGECYIHGFMDGEAIDSDQDDSYEFRSTRFTIR